MQKACLRHLDGELIQNNYTFPPKQFKVLANPPLSLLPGDGWDPHDSTHQAYCNGARQHLLAVIDLLAARTRIEQLFGSGELLLCPMSGFRQLGMLLPSLEQAFNWKLSRETRATSRTAGTCVVRGMFHAFRPQRDG